MAFSQKMLTDHVIPQPADSELSEIDLWEFKKTAAAVQGWWHFYHCLHENKGFFPKAVQQQQHHSVVQPYQTKTRILFHLIQTITSYLVTWEDVTGLCVPYHPSSGWVLSPEGWRCFSVSCSSPSPFPTCSSTAPPSAPHLESLGSWPSLPW